MIAMPLVAARADLVLVGPVTIGGTGLGTVNTVLTLSSSGNNTTEQACVISSGGGSNFVTGNLSGSICTAGANSDVKTGASQTQTRSLDQAGITAASNFAILYNASEPAGNGISINSLVAYFTNNTGTSTLAVNLAPGTYDFATTQTGTGNTGLEFVLDAAGQTALQTFINNNGGVANIWVGLGTSAGVPIETTGGNETLFIFNNGLATPVPEPSSVVLTASGLLGLVGFARRRRRK